jgi:hypothetical protein
MLLGDCQSLVGGTAQHWWQRCQEVMMARCGTCGEPMADQQQQQQRRRQLDGVS